jgi:hypothetical protein
MRGGSNITLTPAQPPASSTRREISDYPTLSPYVFFSDSVQNGEEFEKATGDEDRNVGSQNGFATYERCEHVCEDTGVYQLMEVICRCRIPPPWRRSAAHRVLPYYTALRPMYAQCNNLTQLTVFASPTGIRPPNLFSLWVS